MLQYTVVIVLIFSQPFADKSSLNGSDEDEGLGKSPTHVHVKIAKTFQRISELKRQSSRPKEKSSVTLLQNKNKNIEKNEATLSGKRSGARRRSSADEHVRSPRSGRANTRLVNSHLSTGEVYIVPKFNPSSRSVSPVRRTTRERAASITRLVTGLESAKDNLDKNLANVSYVDLINFQNRRKRVKYNIVCVL